MKFLLFLPLILIITGCNTSNSPHVATQKPSHLGMKGSNLQSVPFKDRLLIAVVRVENQSNYYQLNTGKLMNSAIVSLYNTKRFRVIERDKMELLFNEMNLTESGLVSSNPTEIGNLLGVDAVLIINISSANYFTEQTLMLENLRKVRTKMSGRLIDVQSGEILASTITDNTCTRSENMIGNAITGSQKFYKDDFINDCLTETLHTFAIQLARETPTKSEIYR